MGRQVLAVILLALLGANQSWADTRPQAALLLAASDTSNPYNSPTKRINPNSRQSTTAPNPQVRPSGPVNDNPRPPTLNNRGIGNGENLRRPPVDNRQPRP